MLHIIFNSEYKNDDQPFIKGLPKMVRNNCVEIPNPIQFKTLLASLKNDELVMIWVHIGTILASKLALPGMVVEYAKEAEEFLDDLKIEYKKITRGSEIAAKTPDIVFTNDMVDISKSLKKYSVSELRPILSIKPDDKIKVEDIKSIEPGKDKKKGFPKIKYAIITALYDIEFEEVKKVFNFPDEEEIEVGDKTYYIGYLNNNPDIKVVAGIPFNTGMVDASIMATQMLEIFHPDYILMSGVCGGFIDDCNLGDIVIARNVYTFQKGKLSDIKTKDKEGNFAMIDLYDKDKNVVHYDKLYDIDGNQISISVERFKREDDSVITIDHFKDKYDKHKNTIIDKINRKIKDDLPIKLTNDVNLHYEPMACSTMVINKEGFFEDTLKAIDRKTIAVEMESYGVARACRYANEGKTKPLIFKSIMDFTYNKSDSDGSINWKKVAAFTSAQFMGLLFENKII